MNRTTYRLAAGAALVVAAVTACGGTTGTGTKPASPSLGASAQAASNGVDKMSAAQATRAALAALAAAHSVRVRGTYLSDGQRGSFDVRVTDKGSSGSMTVQGATFETVLIDKGSIYLKGSESSWTAAGLPQNVASLVADRWVKTSDTSQGAIEVFSLTKFTTQLARHVDAAGATTGPATVGGQKAVVITYRDGSKLYVACTGPAYPLRYVETGSDGGQGDFSEYGAGFHIAPPPNAVDLSQSG